MSCYLLLETYPYTPEQATQIIHSHSRTICGRVIISVIFFTGVTDGGRTLNQHMIGQGKRPHYGLMGQIVLANNPA